MGEHRDDVVVEAAERERDAELGVGLVDVGVGLQAQVVLGGDAHVAQAGLAGVAGAGVDPGEVDHARERSAHPPTSLATGAGANEPANRATKRG